MTTQNFPESNWVATEPLTLRQVGAILQEIADGADQRLDDENADRQLIAEDMTAQLNHLIHRLRA